METFNKVIKSTKVGTGKRTYYIDQLETKTGGTYLKVKEYTIMGEGKTETHRLLIFEENIKAFVEALSAMIPAETTEVQNVA
jgi:hypothetical protein